MKISKKLRDQYIADLALIAQNEQILAIEVEYKKVRYFVEKPESLQDITKLMGLALDLPYRELKNGRSPINFARMSDVRYTLKQSFLNVGINPPTIKGVL